MLDGSNPEMNGLVVSQGGSVVGVGMEGALEALQGAARAYADDTAKDMADACPPKGLKHSKFQNKGNIKPATSGCHRDTLIYQALISCPQSVPSSIPTTCGFNNNHPNPRYSGANPGLRGDDKEAPWSQSTQLAP